MSDQNPVKKTYQLSLTLHFTVEVDESTIPTTGVNATPSGVTRTGDDNAWRQSDEIKRRLLHAVLAQKETTDAYLLFSVVSQISGWTWQEWHETLRGIDEEDLDYILAPAIKTLPQDDQKYFAGAEKNHVFFEATEIFQDCWSTRMEDAEISIDGSNYDPPSR